MEKREKIGENERRVGKRGYFCVLEAGKEGENKRRHNNNNNNNNRFTQAHNSLTVNVLGAL